MLHILGTWGEATEECMDEFKHSYETVPQNDGTTITYLRMDCQICGWYMRTDSVIFALRDIHRETCPRLIA